MMGFVAQASTQNIMASMFTIILLTAILSSCFTLVLAYLLYQAFLKKRLANKISEISQLLEESVRKGMVNAGDDLLPEFEERVNNGFTKALTQALGGKILSNTAEHLAKNGKNILEQGLDLFMGGVSKKKASIDRNSQDSDLANE